MNTKIPQMSEHLPAFMSFVSTLAESYAKAELQSWQDVASPTREFFTSDYLDGFDRIIPGWKKMSSDADGQTMIHIVCVFIALLNSPEYQDALSDQKALLEWSILLHDIAKQSIEGQRDLTHAFRSAADAAVILSSLGFDPQMADPSFFLVWITETKNAYIFQNDVAIPDNAKLPEIISGIDAVFGTGQPGSLIVKSILFHMSLEAEKDWPCAAPFTGDEIQQYLDIDLLQLLGALMLADSASYNLFDHITRERYRSEILESLNHVRQLLNQRQKRNPKNEL